MILDLIFLALWVGVTWTAGAAVVGDPGPWGFGILARSLRATYMPDEGWVLPAIALVGAFLVWTQFSALFNRTAGGHHMVGDQLVDRSGRPIRTFGPFTWRR